MATDIIEKIRAARTKMKELAKADEIAETIGWLLQDMPSTYGGPLIELLRLCDVLTDAYPHSSTTEEGSHD